MSTAHTVEQLGSRLRTVRTLRGMSQRRLAELTDSSATMISHVEQGRKLPSLGAFADWCRILECSADFLLSATGPIEVPLPQRETSS